MKVKILKKKKNKMEFVLEGATISFANALRRVMISEVPTLAIEWVTIKSNSSSMFDELLAQRLGMLPLLFDPAKFNFQSDCKCKKKGCPLCQVTFVLERKGPCIAYSGDLKSSNKAVKPTDPGFPLIDLLDNHEIKFEATACLGIGKEHAKFQAANAAFQNYPEMNGKEINKDPKAFLFKIESISGLPTDYIVSTAAEVLEGKAKEFKKEAAKL